jgi:hypothetical protein
MIAETVVKSMIRKRLRDGLDLPAAFDNVIAAIEDGVKEIGDSARALNKKLEDAIEPDEYIKRRLEPYGIQAELQMFLLHTARQLKESNWQP